MAGGAGFWRTIFGGRFFLSFGGVWLLGRRGCGFFFGGGFFFFCQARFCLGGGGGFVVWRGFFVTVFCFFGGSVSLGGREGFLFFGGVESFGGGGFWGFFFFGGVFWGGGVFGLGGGFFFWGGCLVGGRHFLVLGFLVFFFSRGVFCLRRGWFPFSGVGINPKMERLHPACLLSFFLGGVFPKGSSSDLEVI